MSLLSQISGLTVWPWIRSVPSDSYCYPRWSGVTMLTIRESSWLTENTYSYEEVVKMMAELLGAFQGDIRVRSWEGGKGRTHEPLVVTEETRGGGKRTRWKSALPALSLTHTL